jgi:anionic cell wall polymer biosynthesis LytR-Cps2A-Psr (LCP) family protein
VTVDNGQAFTVGSTTFNAGPINLDGEEALVYARYRGGADGDFGRIDRQQQIVRALISQTSGMDVVTGAYRLLGAVEGHVKTDLAVTDMITLANSFRASCNEATLEVDTLDGIVATYPDPLLNMNLSYVVVDPAEIERKVTWLLENP